MGTNPINPSPPNSNFFSTLKYRINNISDYIADDLWYDYRHVTHKNAFRQWWLEFEESFTSGMANDLLEKGFQMWAEQTSIEDPRIQIEFSIVVMKSNYFGKPSRIAEWISTKVGLKNTTGERLKMRKRNRPYSLTPVE